MQEKGELAKMRIKMPQNQIKETGAISCRPLPRTFKMGFFRYKNLENNSLAIKKRYF